MMSKKHTESEVRALARRFHGRYSKGRAVFPSNDHAQDFQQFVRSLPGSFDHDYDTRTGRMAVTVDPAFIRINAMTDEEGLLPRAKAHAPGIALGLAGLGVLAAAGYYAFTKKPAVAAVAPLPVPVGAPVRAPSPAPSRAPAYAPPPVHAPVASAPIPRVPTPAEAAPGAFAGSGGAGVPTTPITSTPQGDMGISGTAQARPAAQPADEEPSFWGDVKKFVTGEESADKVAGGPGAWVVQGGYQEAAFRRWPSLAVQINEAAGAFDYFRQNPGINTFLPSAGLSARPTPLQSAGEALSATRQQGRAATQKQWGISGELHTQTQMSDHVVHDMVYNFMAAWALGYIGPVAQHAHAVQQVAHTAGGPGGFAPGDMILQPTRGGPWVKVGHLTHTPAIGTVEPHMTTWGGSDVIMNWRYDPDRCWRVPHDVHMQQSSQSPVQRPHLAAMHPVAVNLDVLATNTLTAGGPGYHLGLPHTHVFDTAAPALGLPSDNCTFSVFADGVWDSPQCVKQPPPGEAMFTVEYGGQPYCLYTDGTWQSVVHVGDLG